MQVEILEGDVVLVHDNAQTWALGCPEGAGARLKEVGVVPRALLLSRVTAPGLKTFDTPPLVVRQAPLRIDELTAEPIERAHGWDYVVKSNDGTSLLFTERGDVSAGDVEGHDLAIIGNKYRADAFAENVITRPWPVQAWSLSQTAEVETGKELLETEKVWSDIGDVPDQVKKHQDVPLTLEQANFVARIAKASGGEEGENWAIAWNQFTESFVKKGGRWVRRKKLETEKEFVQAKLEEMRGRFRKQFPSTPPYDYWFVDYDPVTMTAIVEENGTKHIVKYQFDDSGDIIFDSRINWALARQLWLAGKEMTLHGPVQRLGDVFISRLHTAYNDFADTYFGQGYMNQEERMVIGKAIGDGLDAVRAALPQDLNDRPLNVPPHMLEMMTAEGVADMAPGEMAFKEVEGGRYRWYSLTATDAWDLQGERVTEKAMDWSLMLASLMDDRGPLLFRHLPLKVGSCDKQVRAGPLLFESGLTDPLDQNPVARAFVEKVKEEPGRWQISPGLRFRDQDLLSNGEYERCWIAERSATDRPANPTTAFAFATWRSKEMKVTDKLLQEAADQLGLPLEQVKALAAEYLDRNKEYTDLEEALKEMATKAVGGFQTQDKAKKMPPDEEDDTEEEDMMEEETPPPPRQYKKKEAPDRLTTLLEQNTRALTAVAKALQGLATESSGSIQASARAALKEYLETAPKAEAAQFATAGGVSGAEDEESVRAMLKEVNDKLTVLTTTRGYPNFEAMFTSDTLNRPRTGAPQ